ncbi:CRISPR-associated protein Csx15 [Candidatus Desulforudis audaxviator]|uniref:Putative transcriptional regulator n=1 Tax=Desulforudis audaxviator (strain MP104C) TaxID=477974 RepID=B1I5L1_DESAP|nr:CRISPR-associated protein Csx15 [Candidatus Desulforudis audaxviator]ACA60320.1 putative transcriptional regulator [Candidatus Desulforudis audaxviator MP104C]
MNEAIWRRIKRYVDLGREAPKVELKQTLDLSTREKQAEFVKDVTAIANTPGGTGYVIIGVLDNTKCPRDRFLPENYVVGFSPSDPDELERQMIVALSNYCDPAPEIAFTQVLHPQTGRNIGVVTIARSAGRPHKFIRGSTGIERQDVFIRRGTATFKASPQEIIEMAQAPAFPEVIAINFSSHPLTSFQQEQLRERFHVHIEELIELPVHFLAQEDLKPQAKKWIEEVGLALEEWSEKNIVLILPGLAPGAATILAAIHGLRGGFPKILWVYQAPNDRTQYEVAQVVDLQALRDMGREIRSSVL